jgi:hypothetical protein
MFPSTLLIELVAVFAAISYLRRLNNYWVMFIPFLLCTAVIDGTGWVMATQKINNHWLYNIQFPIEMLFNCWLLTKLFDTRPDAKKWFSTLFVFYLVVYLTEISIKGFYVYAAFSDTIGTILIVISCFVYFYILLEQPRSLNLLIYGPFWIVAGMFLFYFCSLTSKFFFKELMQLHVIGGLPLRYFIFTILNLILYSFWIVAFKCQYRQII